MRASERERARERNMHRKLDLILDKSATEEDGGTSEAHNNTPGTIISSSCRRHHRRRRRCCWSAVAALRSNAGALSHKRKLRRNIIKRNVFIARAVLTTGGLSISPALFETRERVAKKRRLNVRRQMVIKLPACE
jgi:hypothetical protein